MSGALIEHSPDWSIPYIPLGFSPPASDGGLASRHVKPLADASFSYVPSEMFSYLLS